MKMANPGVMQLASLDLDEQNALKFLQIMRKTGPVAEALAHLFKLLSRLGGRTVEQYCTGKGADELWYTPRQYKSAFNQDERNTFNGIWNPEDLDITGQYNLLQRCCGLAKPGDPKWQQQNTLENHIYCLKQHRNRMAHELIRLKSKDLQDKVGELQNHIEEIFKMTGNALHIGKDEAINKIKEILVRQFTTPQALADCQKFIMLHKNESLNYIFWIGRQELLSHHSTLKCASPITWKKHDSQDVMDIMELFTTLRTEKTDSPITLEEIISSKEVLILQGLPGSGKSALSVHLANSWSKQNDDIKGLKNSDLWLLLRCRYIKINDLAKYLKDIMIPNALKYVDQENVIQILKEVSQLCFFIDGYDEAGPEAKELLKQIFAMLPKSKFLITSRPEFTKDLQTLIRNGLPIETSKVVNILGFSMENVFKYVKKVFDKLCPADMSQADRDKSRENLEKFIKNKQRLLKELITIPLTLGFIIILWIEDSVKISNASTATDIYDQLLHLLISHLIARLCKRPGECRTYDDLYPICLEWMRALGKEAFEALKKNDTCLSPRSTNKLQNLCDSLKIDRTEVFQAILISDEQERSIHHPYLVWSFFHKTIQEYVAALSICHDHNESINQLTIIHSPFLVCTCLHKRLCKYICNSVNYVPIDTADQCNSDSDDLFGNLLSSVKDPTPICVFITGILIASGKMDNKTAASIVKFADTLKTFEIIGKIVIESKNHNEIKEKVKDKLFKINAVNTDNCATVKTVLDCTQSSLSTYVEINVGDETSSLEDFIEESCKRLEHFKPKVTCKTEDALRAAIRELTHISVDCVSYRFSFDFYISDPNASDGVTRATVHLPQFPCYILQDISNIMSTHPEIDPAHPPLTPEIRDLRYEITDLQSAQVPLALWLLQHTQCRLSLTVVITGGPTDEVLEFLQDQYKELWYFKPAIAGLTSVSGVHKICDLVEQMGGQQDDCLEPVELIMLTKGGGFGMLGGTPLSVSELLSRHPGLEQVALGQDAAPDAARPYRDLRYDITEVRQDQWPIVAWLMDNAHYFQLSKEPRLYITAWTDTVLRTVVKGGYYLGGPQFTPSYICPADGPTLRAGPDKLMAMMNNGVTNDEGFKVTFSSFTVRIGLSCSVPLSLPITAPPPFPPPPPPRRRR